MSFHLFFFNNTPTTEIYTLSLHDALPIYDLQTLFRARWTSEALRRVGLLQEERGGALADHRSEEHTSELQSRVDLVCRLLLEKKKKGRVVDQQHNNDTKETVSKIVKTCR